jgi:hypothetical protein
LSIAGGFTDRQNTFVKGFGEPRCSPTPTGIKVLLFTVPRFTQSFPINAHLVPQVSPKPIVLLKCADIQEILSTKKDTGMPNHSHHLLQSSSASAQTYLARNATNMHDDRRTSCVSTATNCK